jgi:hypothetical protein
VLRRAGSAIRRGVQSRVDLIDAGQASPLDFSDKAAFGDRTREQTILPASSRMTFVADPDFPERRGLCTFASRTRNMEDRNEAQ